jgi:peptidoglycan/xylan/chitin deacetylase (PgdA/CDA1 family)
MPTLSADSIKSEIEFTSALVAKYVGERPQLFRPPYIALNKTMFDNIDLTFICGEGSNDWEDNVSADQRVEKILASAKDGLIYLLHDFEGNGKTVEAVDRIIPVLKERGFTFVTVRELMKQKNIKPQPGVIYTDVLNVSKWK